MINKRNTAPEITGYSRVFQAWKRTHLGNKEDFYKFLTSPSIEREEFLAGLSRTTKMVRGVVIDTYTVWT